MSLGPEPVTDHVRAEERAEERARRQAEEPRVVSGQKTVAPKKKKAIPPELEERQKRASARMLELGALHSRQEFIITYYTLLDFLVYIQDFPLQSLHSHTFDFFSGKGS